MAAYDTSVQSGKVPATGNAKAGSLRWLIDRYRQTPVWTHLLLATRRQHENILKQIIKTAGIRPFTASAEGTVIAGRDRRKLTQGWHFIDALRGLFAWVKDAQFVSVHPAAGVKYLHKRKIEGFPVWTENEVVA